jgi:protein TonB
MESTPMASSPAPSAPPPKPSLQRLLHSVWFWIGLAFLAGLVLFVLAIRPQKHGEFFRAGEVPPSTAEPAYAPLPAPMVDDGGSGIGPLEPPPPAPVDAAPERQVAERPAPAPVARPVPEPRAPAVADRKARALPGQTPPPVYPTRALRDGTEGTALVLVHLGPDGVPTSTAIAQSSGSRDLDRAAMQAVRRWRFEPAIADGHPVVADVVIPIDFRLSD